jgi:hypothetical protein
VVLSTTATLTLRQTSTEKGRLLLA